MRPAQLRLKIYRRGGLIALVRSGAGAREFRLPGARGNARRALAGGLGYIHDFRVEIGAEADIDAILARAARDRARDRQRPVRRRRERRVQPARPLCRARHPGGGVAARLVPLPPPDRQQLRPGDDRRCAAPRAQCDARADRPVRRRPRSVGQGPRRAQVDEVSRRNATARWRKVRSIDDDRILRRLRALVEAIVRTNAFAPAADGSAGVQDRLARWFRAFRRRCRGARSGSTARASRASICAAGRSPAAGFAGPTGATISAPKSSA